MNKKTLAFLLTLSLTSSLVPLHISATTPVLAVEEVQISNGLTLDYVYSNIDNLVDLNQLSDIARLRNIPFTPEKIQSVKQLKDFNGYPYYVVEFAPSGYAIYDNKFANILEFNARAVSPYNGYNDNMIYAGAGEYYVKATQTNKTEMYLHTVLESALCMDVETEQFYKAQSLSVSNAVEQAAVSKLSENNISPLGNNTVTSYVSLSDYSSITDCDTTGFNTDGNCGYIAGSLIVWYHYDVLGWEDFVPGGVYSHSLVCAIQGNRENDTLGPGLQDALSEWSYNHGAVEEGGWQESLPAIYDVLPSGSKIYNLIDDDRPVALLGKTPSQSDLDSNSSYSTYSTNGKVNHVITVTGVTRESSSYSYFAHFGWETEYNDVYVSDSSLVKGSIVYY